MEKLKLYCVVFATALLVYSCETKKNTDSREVAEDINEEKFESNKAEKDADFVLKAAEGGMFEVEVAKLAEQKASHEKVKEFAKHMVNNHTKSNEELKNLAAQKNITLPAGLSDDKKDKINKLSGLNGEEFDKEYMDLMVKDHKDNVDEFDDAAKDANDPEVESWASKTLPTLQEHLEMAKQTEDQVKEYYNKTSK